MKRHELMGKEVGVFCTRALALALLVAACGGALGKAPGVGSESHFLGSCELGCGPGLDCIGGICTRSCLTERASCSDLAPAAKCTNQSVEPGEVAVCDVSCRATADCEGVGDGYSCSSGFCRLMLDRYCSDGPCSSGAGGGMNSGSATGGSSAGGTGGGSISGGTPETEIDCELFRDQSPPPDARTISITNTGEVPVYIQPFMLDCTAPTSLVQVERDGETVNVHGIRNCGLSCEDALDQGWRLAPPCFADCNAPQLVQILPGQTLQQPANLEVAPLDLPQACAAGIESASARCLGRVIPRPADYTLTVRALMDQPCSEGPACECRPGADGRCSVEFSDRLMRSQAAVAFPFMSGWYYQNQELTIGLPAS